MPPVSRRAFLSSSLVAMAGSRVAVSAPSDLAAALEKIRVDAKLPALAAISIRDGKVSEQAAVGFRRSGKDEAVTVEDKWHIGSCTKSMTSTLAAMMVEQGRITWKTTVGEQFPELRSSMGEGWAGVTLEQLLAHRGG